ncbi:phosphoribosylanthranilate isomerase [Ferruginibacter paludis]|uniref:phosphoribosylanthranilate isomerase n=1 Tax=Ferruginibacter TaxID=1004303 RepID=UPI0025B29D56|nr:MULTISPECIES: phosphoribosylanthranilate isomerase [Ferruginibacter]MDB5277149.1 phosphoribosylanthranilate isomerase [Ferruginibacter sp.]MDN3656380.1 phosphoribosylanthranilate isomerase [Ferruginibacter paludis]
MRVKVCGITQEEQLVKLPETGATFAGLIFYPKSPRYVLRQMTTTQIKKESNVNKVGVFVNASVEEVLHMVDECRLHMVQLHGDETPKYCEKIADYISVVKAFRISDSDNIGWRIKDYMEVCDMFMFDTEGAGYGGTGKKFDWGKLHDVAVGKPYFLSGGIEPGDVEKLKAFSQLPEAKGLFAIDINSKFEILPGVKDMEKIKKFIQQL